MAALMGWTRSKRCTGDRHSDCVAHARTIVVAQRAPGGTFNWDGVHTKRFSCWRWESQLAERKIELHQHQTDGHCLNYNMALSFLSHFFLFGIVHRWSDSDLANFGTLFPQQILWKECAASLFEGFVIPEGMYRCCAGVFPQLCCD